MTDQPGGGDGGDDPPKPPKRPDPFAPLPLADLPPVRRRGPADPQEAAPRPAGKSKSKGTASAPPDTRAPPPPASAAPDTRAPATAASESPDTRAPATAASESPDTLAPATAASASPDPLPVLPDMRGPTPSAPAGTARTVAEVDADRAAQATETSTSTDAPMSWTDLRSPSGSRSPSESGAAAQPTEVSGAMSWTDMPSPADPRAPGGTPSAPSDASGAMSWTDMPAPQVSGPDMSGAQPSAGPDTRASAEPLLPASYSENDLRDAVGATQIPQASDTTSKASRSKRRAPTDDDDDDGDNGKPRSRKTMLFGALTLVVGGGIAAMVILGKVNSQRYLITCEADRVVVERGRSFPPWGETSLDGAEWKALKIPPEAPCAPYETENKAELAAHYFTILKEHATSLLTAREVTKIDEAEAQLKQALLVARSLQLDDERIDARDEIERLLGDVGYWRASAKLRSASEALNEAAQQFEMAAQQRPRHVTDAAAWAAYVRKLVEQLRAGPAGAAQTTFPPLPPGERPTAPPGVALPVEPGAGSGSADEPAPAPPADAGLPTGGVLL